MLQQPQQQTTPRHLHVRTLDPAAMPTAGKAVSTGHLQQKAQSELCWTARDFGAKYSLVAAGESACNAISEASPRRDPLRGHGDVAIGAGVMASGGVWRPQPPQRSGSFARASAGCSAAGTPTGRRPCIGRLAQHIILHQEGKQPALRIT
eukprot:TRINITY_DN16012_c0_g1_i1.p2 TRINITY_DN16012_c0_g1~~TRINITY_DN16012_c0_g1_i1.p2  ORF type:complete len:150 (-),score=36.44 TRINITY_DN16012_c0_g1_i1:369-818(-)